LPKTLVKRAEALLKAQCGALQRRTIKHFSTQAERVDTFNAADIHPVMTGLTQGLVKRIDTAMAAEVMFGDTAGKFIGGQRIILYVDGYLIRSQHKAGH
jgi:hypothetical protein